MSIEQMAGTDLSVQGKQAEARGEDELAQHQEQTARSIRAALQAE